MQPFPVGQIDDLSLVDRLRLTWRDLRFSTQYDAFSVVPPGHYHSPVPALSDVRARDGELFRERAEMPGIDLRVAEQLALARELAPLAAEQPFTAEVSNGLRYQLGNAFFSNSDGIVYHCLLRRWQPRRVIEVGSGFSTALLLDTADRYFDERPEITAIDPNPQRLQSLVRADERLTIIPSNVESLSPSVFEALEPGDVLFIDSSHVSKVGSDVNFLFLEVLPTLPAGVHVHVHDMHYPEYPRQFVYGGMPWNELYLVRALLIGNAHLRVSWWNAYLVAHHHAEVGELLPGWGAPGHSSLWLETC